MSVATATYVNPRRLREYETIYILESTIDPDEADRVATRIKEIISARTGHLLKIDNWGKRRLAYPIRKSSRGVFVFVKYLGFEDLVAEIERNLRLLDAVVRYQTVVMKPDVKPEAYQIDPADLEFRRLEVSEESEEELGIAQRLGLRRLAIEEPHDLVRGHPLAATASRRPAVSARHRSMAALLMSS